MARPRSVAFATPVAAVRAHFGLSLAQLAAWLGVSVGFADALCAGRKPLPAALTERLLVLARLLPPPLGSGPPAPPPLPAEPVLPPAHVAPLPPDGLGWAPDPAPLHAAARTARLAARTAERTLLRLHTRAVGLAHRRRGLAQLQAAPPPPAPAEAARWAGWLAALAADLAHADPRPAQAAAARHRLAVRAAAAEAEAAALEALVAAAEKK